MSSSYACGMYKSPAAQASKDMMAQLREYRQNLLLAQEDGRYDDAQDYQEKIDDLEPNWNVCAPAGTAPTARW